MNVLFIEGACDGTVGGSHTCLYNLINNLDRSKYKVWVGFYQHNSYVDKFRKIGIDVILLKRDPLVGGNTFVRKIRNWYRLVHRHRLALSSIIFSHRIELVVINNTISGGNDYVHVCKRFHVPIIAYERGNLQYTNSDISLSKKINASIAVSYAILNNMVQQKYAANTRVIYDGLPIKKVMPSRGKPISSDTKREIGIPDNGIVIGIIGNIREWKGQEYFVKAFLELGKRYSNMYALVIGGYGTEDREYIDRLERLTKGSEFDNRLIYLGFRDDIPDLLNILDVFIHASIKPEPFGMVLLEAMINKIPVIATDFGGPVEILANGNCGILVTPHDEKAIVDGVEKYLNQPIFREEMINNAYSRVETEFDLQTTVYQVDNLFQEVVNGAGY